MPTPLESVERGVDRPVGQIERSARNRPQPLHDRVAVQSAGVHRGKQEHFEMAFEGLAMRHTFTKNSNVWDGIAEASDEKPTRIGVFRNPERV